MGVNVNRRKHARARAATDEEGAAAAEGGGGAGGGGADAAGGGVDAAGGGVEGDTIYSEIGDLLDEVESDSSE